MRQNGKRKKRRTFIPTIILLLIVLACGLYIRHEYSQETAEEMVEYTVTRGTIKTYKSFSATLSVENSETFTNTEGVTMVKELYVTSGQEVQKGDSILTLGTGKTYEASMAGTVNEIRFKKGDFVWPNISLAQVCDLEHLIVQLQVDEYDIKKVELGQECVVTIIPLSMEFETVISHVNRMSASNGRVAYYPVTAKLTVPENVLPGMAVSVRLADETAENVLTLPMAAISFEDDEPCVRKKTANGYEVQPVETGLSDGMQIEITSGLSEGETIYAPRKGSDEEETGFLTRLMRKVFGTRTVIQEEQTRGSRGGNRGGAMPEGGSPELPGDGSFKDMSEMNGQMPEGVFPRSSTDGEAAPFLGTGDDASEDGTKDNNRAMPAGMPSKLDDAASQTENTEKTDGLQTTDKDTAAGESKRTESSESGDSTDGSTRKRPEMPADMQRPDTDGNGSSKPEFPGRSRSDSSQTTGEENAQ